ncbi:MULTISPECIES: hypothetical protein [Cronobacter]|uniref:hypothetical protein n=1 Tax=Cronobacter TaxID=413496 RepID=UPI000BE95305|nr:MULTISPECIES: hypothetical protein [Cronobacter]NCH53481.1 hypothetical protein [Cronobacter muytjensii]PQV82285.1 hypothetical protein CDT99_22110 [Cronobacter sakazakii]HDK7323775.1 hypothetical protein [Cronobacter sakazakii]
MDVTFMLAAYGAAGVTLLLIVAGRVTVREYFKRKTVEKQADIDTLVEKCLSARDNYSAASNGEAGVRISSKVLANDSYIENDIIHDANTDNAGIRQIVRDEIKELLQAGVAIWRQG